jgi:hypothetical protein
MAQQHLIQVCAKLAKRQGTDALNAISRLQRTCSRSRNGRPLLKLRDQLAQILCHFSS